MLFLYGTLFKALLVYQYSKELTSRYCTAGHSTIGSHIVYSGHTLNHMANANVCTSEVYHGPVLVLQGRRDPLIDATARANLIKQLCSNVEVRGGGWGGQVWGL